MSGETNLETLLAGMQPALHDQAYAFCVVDRDDFGKLPFEPLCIFREEEGITVIVTQQQATDNGLTFDSLWACITLTVHSSLSAVGFLAAITSRLAQARISVNAVSAYYHDHLFVPWNRRNETLKILGEMSKGSCE
ncbi:MAG: ACT domain-containing protein [Chloroflexi bacterium]|nr:ACT domain-containing protein [Chloroflexota bacterium]